MDILQPHNPPGLPDPDDANSAYAGLLEARERGKARFLGITDHRLRVAVSAVESGLFDTVQFPLSALSSPQELRFVELCQAHDVGVIAMKALCGGLIRNIPAAFAFLPPVRPRGAHLGHPASKRAGAVPGPGGRPAGAGREDAGRHRGRAGGAGRRVLSRL
ncbi:MAG: hypothetical protein B1H04_00560, partial [Planctomycetales bacterium 4484_123]